MRTLLLSLAGLLVGVTLILTTVSAARVNPSVKWDMQLNSTQAYFQSVGMCKGTTDATRKVGFAGSEVGPIWRTLDGVNWNQVAVFPTSAYWYGVYCFPDAKRVLAVGFSDGDDSLDNGAMITWSFDGGDTWTKRQLLPGTRQETWLQSVHFYNDTHGIILPFNQESVSVVYYTTNGGKTAADWKLVQLEEETEWWQSHPVWEFGGITKTFAQNEYFGTFKFCSSDDAGMSWNCDLLAQDVMVGSFVSSNDAIAVAGNNQTDGYNIYSTQNGGLTWTPVSALPNDISTALELPTDMVWFPNSDVVILAGGNQFQGTVAHSLDQGVTWVESMPQLPLTQFTSTDWVATSATTAELWAVGFNEVSSIILHATVTVA